jgi:hypothetical protein
LEYFHTDQSQMFAQNRWLQVTQRNGYVPTAILLNSRIFWRRERRSVELPQDGQVIAALDMLVIPPEFL